MLYRKKKKSQILFPPVKRFSHSYSLSHTFVSLFFEWVTKNGCSLSHTHTHTHTPRSSISRKQLLSSRWWWWPGSGLWITPLFWLPVFSFSLLRMRRIWHGSRGRRGQRSALTGLCREGMVMVLYYTAAGCAFTCLDATPCARVLKRSCDWTQRWRERERSETMMSLVPASDENQWSLMIPV